MAMFVSLIFAFTACEKQPEGPNGENPSEEPGINTENAEEVADLRIYYQSVISQYFPNLAQFAFEAYTGTVTYDFETKKLSGDGLVVQLLQAVTFDDNYFPTATKYSPFELEGNNVADVFDGGAIGVQIVEVQNGEIVGSMDTREFTVQCSGDINNYEYVLEANFDGETLVFKYEGQPEVVASIAFTKEDLEPTTQYTGEEVYAEAEVIYYGDVNLLPVNLIEVVLINNDRTSFANFICYGSLDDITNVYGTFKVDNKHHVGTMAKSPGVNLDAEQAYVLPSFIARNYSTNSADYYLPESGSLNISENEISFDLVSENGSKITTKFNGKISVKSYDEAYGAPQARVAAVKKAIKAVNAQPLNYNPIKLF